MARQRLDSVHVIYFNKKSAAQRKAGVLFLRKRHEEIKSKTMDKEEREDTGRYQGKGSPVIFTVSWLLEGKAVPRQVLTVR
jgi:hypothetical protein